MTGKYLAVANQLLTTRHRANKTPDLILEVDVFVIPFQARCACKCPRPSALVITYTKEVRPTSTRLFT